jgi:hypothetical protein
MSQIKYHNYKLLSLQSDFRYVRPVSRAYNFGSPAATVSYRRSNGFIATGPLRHITHSRNYILLPPPGQSIALFSFLSFR